MLGALRGGVLPGPGGDLQGLSLEKELSQPDTHTLATKQERPVLLCFPPLRSSESAEQAKPIFWPGAAGGGGSQR